MKQRLSGTALVGIWTLAGMLGGPFPLGVVPSALAQEQAPGDSKGSGAASAGGTSSSSARAPSSAGAVTGTIISGMTSTKAHSVVSVMSDPVLSEGRLVLKVIAFNRTRAVASFGPQDIKVFTADGRSVEVMTLDQLVQQAKGGGTSSDRGVGTDYNPNNYSGPVVTHDRSGRPDVSGFTGGANNVDSITGSGARPRDNSKSENDPKVQQQIASLQTAILRPMTIEPATAAGGQIVTQKIKFDRKEQRSLRVVIDFNGEEHEFDFPVPPAH